MNHKVYKVVTPHIKLTEMIVQCKSEHTYRTVGAKTPPCLHIRQILNTRIVNNTVQIIKIKGTFK